MSDTIAAVIIGMLLALLVVMSLYINHAAQLADVTLGNLTAADEAVADLAAEVERFKVEARRFQEALRQLQESTNSLNETLKETTP